MQYCGLMSHLASPASTIVPQFVGVIDAYGNRSFFPIGEEIPLQWELIDSPLTWEQAHDFVDGKMVAQINGMEVPNVPTRSWRIAQVCNACPDETLKILEAFSLVGSVEKIEGSELEGGGFYYRSFIKNQQEMN